ncbi:MAG: hypothetical protein ACJAVR_003795 [Paracoccaceae bacterium]
MKLMRSPSFQTGLIDCGQITATSAAFMRKSQRPFMLCTPCQTRFHRLWIVRHGEAERGERMTDRNNGSTTEGRDRRGRFGTGNSGRPRGARHKTTQAVLTLMEGEGEALGRKAVELAMAGDRVALRLCLDRIAPAPKDAPVSFALPSLSDAKALRRRWPHWWRLWQAAT